MVGTVVVVVEVVVVVAAVVAAREEHNRIRRIRTRKRVHIRITSMPRSLEAFSSSTRCFHSTGLQQACRHADMRA